MKKLIFTSILTILLYVPLHHPPHYATANENHKIAIVIDDFGNNSLGTKEMLDLPISLTAAVMPFLPSSKKDAILAHEKKKEVIIHLPMESYNAKPSWYGPRPILTSMSDDEIKKIVYDAIEDVPFAVGMNNHMGSKATSDKRVMKIILQICKEKGYYFLNSKTNSSTVPKEIAIELGVPYLENNLFFDHVYEVNHINKQAQLLIEQVKKEKEVIIIGHVGIPGKMTSQAIQSNIQRIKTYATFYTASKLINNKK